MATGSSLNKTYLKGKRYLKDQWDSLLWILASFGVLYLFEFASNVLFNPLVKRLGPAFYSMHE